MPFQKNENQKFPKNKKLDRLFLNYKQFIYFLNNLKKDISKLKEKINNLNLLIELKIEKKDENRNNPFKNINCEYILNNPKYYDINVKKYIIKDILIIEKNEIFELFLLDIIEINFGITQHQENNLKFNWISKYAIYKNE